MRLGGRVLGGWAAVAALALGGGAQTTSGGSYYEFGTVVALGKKTVDIQTFNPQLQRVVQHSFELTREARVDLVHVGDAVEVLYSPTTPAWTLRRLIALGDGIPVAGPPRGTSTAGAAAASAGAPAVASGSLTEGPKGTVPVASSAALGAPAAPRSAASAAPPKPTKASKSAAAAAAKAAAATGTTALGAGAKAPAAVVAVAPGAAVPVTATRPVAPSVKGISIEGPSDGCQRSSTEWPSQPMRIAVLDFRYPTEREEAHDIGSTGGGSGTALADLVLTRLGDHAPEDVQFSRGDRRRLDKTDFAGAARLGRQLGVDAVFAGTFFPVETPGVQDGYPVTIKTYELHAGLVDTCTGQVLFRVSSVSCPSAIEPGYDLGPDSSGCKRYAVSVSDAANPEAHPAAFAPVLDTLLYPLEHQGKPPVTAPAEGVVTRATPQEVTVQLSGHGKAKSGDEFSVHTWRLAKNPTTYTLQNLQNAEIGRLAVRSVHGSTVTGTYQGDIPPQPGDTIEPITP